ncbi:MAG: glycosyltransferase family 2 protein [Nocardioidaceae bacterium]|nr:glycosyltransferase family 2 protein [Nocardioidaceae bacterium]
MSRLGVITVVAGRHTHLAAQQRSLAAGTRRPDVRIVVAMGDPDAERVMGEATADHPPSGETAVEHLVVPPGSELPLARARNTGARLALDRGAELLVFLDVDCLASPDLLGSYAVASDQLPLDGSPQLLCGPVAYLPELAPGRTGYTSDMLSQAIAHPARPSPLPGEVEASDDFALFWSLSFAVSVKDWLGLDGFDEDYVGYGAEDTDFGQRARQRGGRIWWVGGAFAHHQWHPVSEPPVEHLDAIVRNANVFHEKWGWFPMEGWLADFRRRGLAGLDVATGRWVTRTPVTGVRVATQKAARSTLSW